MRAAKEMLVVCWIITIISFIGLFGLYTELDIYFQEKIDGKSLEYDYDERAFFQGLWSNVFTGAVVSVLTTYVSYNRSKQDLEFEIISNSKITLVCCKTLSSGLYQIDSQNTGFNSWPIFMYKEDIERIASCSDKIIDALKEYCPFFRTRKVKKLRLIAEIMQRLATELDSARKYIMFQSDTDSLNESMMDTANTITEHKEALDKISDILEKW